MRKLLLIFFFSASLFGALPFTLENLTNLRIYMINKSNFIDKQQETQLKEAVAKKLTAAGIVLNATDSSTFMIKIESIQIDETYVVNVGIAVGEEIITKRKDAIQTLAFSYHATDFIKTQEPYAETLESVHYLVDDFIDLYNEDKE
jgi:preprotein translocase subunit Sec61beta